MDAEKITSILDEIGITRLSYKREIKEYCNNFPIDKKDVLKNLADEIGNIINNDIAVTEIFVYEKTLIIVKFRIKDDTSKSGKSGGFRIVGLVDNRNSVFILLSIYRHSGGKDNISEEMKNYYKELCKKYYKETKEE